MDSKQKRPKFLNLFAIHLPVTGVTSFAHRVSGALMVLAIPALVYLFGLSLRDPEGYRTATAHLHGALFKLLASVLAWTFSHHLFAGIRFLLLDINIGEHLQAAKNSAWLVNILAILVFIWLAGKIWL